MERGNGFAHHPALAVLSVAIALVVASPSPARAQVQCGDVVGPKETVTLQGNVEDCPPGAAALTVVGPATLDMNGFSVICREAGIDTPPGIVVVGRRATVRNGAVQHCSTGMRILGEGSHRIEGMTVALTDSGFGEAFVIESDANRLTNNTAVQNDGEGFRILHADRNRLIGNRAFFNRGSGFELSVTQRTVLQDNVARDNQTFGFLVDSGPFTPGGGKNLVKDNVSTGNGIGFFVDGEVGTRLIGNVADANEGDGIFLLLGDKNRLMRNQANENGESGIVLLSEDRAQVMRNTALNNDRGDDGVRHFDLLESVTGCGTNRWRSNVFASANEPCIR